MGHQCQRTAGQMFFCYYMSWIQKLGSVQMFAKTGKLTKRTRNLKNTVAPRRRS
jgi:hypothetical protein